MIQKIKFWLRKYRNRDALKHIYKFGYKQYLPVDELLDIIENAQTKTPYAVGIERHHDMVFVLVWKGYPRTVYRHTYDFLKNLKGTIPDYNNLKIIDCGQTVAFGNYEVATEVFVEGR